VSTTEQSIGGLPVYELPGGARALFTDRSAGNLSSVGGDARELGGASRERLRAMIGAGRLVRGYQVHGAVVGRIGADGSGLVDHDDADQPPFQADGHALAAREAAAMVLVADCVPVVLGARGAVAALHAGWRGLAAGVLEEGVRALRDVGGSGEARALIGPCAGPCCYEVGEEVHAAFGGVHRRGRAIDLRAVARERLLAAGVGHVEDVPGCTICEERFFSHRREGSRAGRQAALAWL
jgi:purine-nucleoside/S-methyl-5'-thioadenosine phosphorylase / adenosine deaminase